MKIRWVKQEHDKGCVVACIAMVLGWKYTDVVKEFQNDFQKQGTSYEVAKDFIIDHGFSVIEKSGNGWYDVREHNKRMMQPFAPVHIVSVQQFIDKPKHGHSFVMDAKGKIFEPRDSRITEVQFYVVKQVMGFFTTNA